MLYSIYRKWKKNRLGRHAAALAYFLFMSLASLALLVSSLIGYFLEDEDAFKLKISSFISEYAGEQLGEAAELILLSMSGESLFVASFGLLVLLISGSWGFFHFQNSLDEIFGDVKRKNIYRMLKDKIAVTLFLSFMSLFVLLLVISSSFISILIRTGFSFLGLPGFLFPIISLVIVFLVVMGLFVLIYRYLPSNGRSWKGARKGALLTATLFIVGSFLFESYFSLVEVSSLYGITGYFMVFLLWLYYMSASVLVGATFIEKE